MDGYPDAAMWCALASIPGRWNCPGWMATLAFDERLPSVVMGMLALWLINRFSAFELGVLRQDLQKWRHGWPGSWEEPSPSTRGSSRGHGGGR